MLLSSGIQRTFLSGKHADFKEVVQVKGEIYNNNISDCRYAHETV